MLSYIHLLITLISMIWYNSVLSIKLGSYNTYQVFTNNFSAKLRPQQISNIGSSDIDVICLQELYSIQSTIGYISALNQFNYTNSFSTLNILSYDDLVTPRIPCNEEIINDFTASGCAADCESTYGDLLAYDECLASLCPDDLKKIIHTECGSCLIIYPSLLPKLPNPSPYTLSIESAFTFCKAPPSPSFDEFWFNLTDGLMIATKTDYPIINTWSSELPSHLLFPTRLHIAEINICSETHTDGLIDNCTDSIIVGCTHLEPTGHVNDNEIPQSPLLSDKTISSHIGLNRFQTEYIIDNWFNDDILEILGIQQNSENIHGVFLTGDLNVGQLFNRCVFSNDEVQIPDNCEGENPSNPFDLYELEGFMDAPDIISSNVLCTYCNNPKSDDFNILTPDPSGTYLNDPRSSNDLDHILVQHGYDINYKETTFSREFLNKSVDGIVDNQLVPTSKHYGVSLNIEFNTKRGNK